MFIFRDIILHLDFTESFDSNNKIYENIVEDDKIIYIHKISLVPKNQYDDFIWPYSLTVIRNNNYVQDIFGLADKNRFVDIIINCKDRYKLVFNNYDPNTIIYLIGRVQEPQGRHLNL